MSVATLILGHSGHGKTTSMRNLKKEDCFLFQAWAKSLPFKNDWSVVSADNPNGNIFQTKSYGAIIKYIDRIVEVGERKIIVIDDFQYLMADEFMRKSEERGFDKFTELAKNVYTLVNYLSGLPDDIRVYIMCHIEEDGGFQKMKTIGKLLDEKITMEGLFSIVLKAVKDGDYVFKTQTSGTDTAKSPMGMFDGESVENDLALVDKKICEFYNIGESDNV